MTKGTNLYQVTYGFLDQIRLSDIQAHSHKIDTDGYLWFFHDIEQRELAACFAPGWFFFILIPPKKDSV